MHLQPSLPQFGSFDAERPRHRVEEVGLAKTQTGTTSTGMPLTTALPDGSVEQVARGEDVGVDAGVLPRDGLRVPGRS